MIVVTNVKAYECSMTNVLLEIQGGIWNEAVADARVREFIVCIVIVCVVGFCRV